MAELVFTPTEAAAVTGLSIRAVNKAIENRLVSTRARSFGGTRKRYLDYAGLVCLQLEAKGLNSLPLQRRKHVFQQVIQSPRQTVIRESEAVLIDVRAAREALAISLSDLRKARQMIVRDPEILQGTPVVRGTRIPVYLIADMLGSGTSVQEILDGYPSLTEESVRLAQLYVRAFPKRGRPPRKKIGKHRVKRSRRPLSAAIG